MRFMELLEKEGSTRKWKSPGFQLKKIHRRQLTLVEEPVDTRRSQKLKYSVFSIVLTL